MVRKRPDRKEKEEALRAAWALNPPPAGGDRLGVLRLGVLRRKRSRPGEVRDAAPGAPRRLDRLRRGRRLRLVETVVLRGERRLRARGHSRALTQAARAETSAQAHRGGRRATGGGRRGGCVDLLDGLGRVGAVRVRCARASKKRRACTGATPKGREGVDTLSVRPATREASAHPEQEVLALGGDRVGDRDPARSWASRGPRPRERRPSAFGPRGRAPPVALRTVGSSSPGSGGVRPCGEAATRVRGGARRPPTEGRWRQLRWVHVARRGRVEEVTQA